MKNLIILMCLIVSLTACGQKDNFVKEPTLIGTWELRQMVTNGPPGYGGVTNFENGRVFTFSTDSTFQDSHFNCVGSFSADSSKVTVRAPCKSNGRPMVFKFAFEDPQTLRLEETPYACDEGCYFIFKRLK